MNKHYIFTARTDKDHYYYLGVDASGKREARKKAIAKCAEMNLKYDEQSLFSVMPTRKRMVL